MILKRREIEDKYGSDDKGTCLCHQCGYTSEATRIPCNDKRCPKCGAKMRRKSEWLIPFDRRVPY